MQTTFKLKPLTEEQISSVVKYFDTWDTWEFTESQIRFMYWRMKQQGCKIDKAEQLINKNKQRQAESYKRLKEQEINRHLKEYRQETAGDTWKYELMKVNEREDWRTLVIGIMKKFDVEKSKVIRWHAVEVSEKKNPDYFQEIIKRFNLVIE